MLQRPIYAYDEDRRIIALAQGSKGIRLWRLDELRSGDEGTPATGVFGRVSSLRGLALTADDALVTVETGGAIRGWSLTSILEGEDPEELWSVSAGFAVAQVASHREAGGRHLMALGGESGQVLLAELNGAEAPAIAQAAEGHGDKVEVLAFSGDDERLATSGRDRKIFVFSTALSGDHLKRLRILGGSGGWPLAMAFSQDHRRLATGSMDNGVYLWDLETEDNPLEAVRFDHHGWVEAITWTDGDEAILTGAWDNLVGVFDPDPLVPRFQFRYHSDYTVALLSVPGTSTVFAASYDGEISVWDWRAGKVLAILQGHTDWVTGLSWLGEGRVASFSSDGTARIWSVEELTVQGVLGEPTVAGFELGGTFDLASFGLEGGSAKREESGPDLGDIQRQGVRAFDRDDPTLQSGSHQTAMEILEDAAEFAASVVDSPSEELSEPEVPEPELPPAGVGDDLSDLVLEAISSPDEIEIDLGTIDPDSATGHDWMEEAGVGEDVEFGQMEEVEDVELNLDGSEEFPSIEEISSQAFMESQDGLDIMDSGFDSLSESGDGEPAHVEPATVEPRRADTLPLSGPLYDPRPIGPDDDLEGILPDDDEIDQAFFGSISEASESDDDPPESDPPESAPREGPPGKADPSSAPFRGEAGGGETGEALGDELSDEDREFFDDMEESHPTFRSSAEVATLQVDAESVARHDARPRTPTGDGFWGRSPFVAVEEDGELDEIDEDYGNSTQFLGGASSAAEDLGPAPRPVLQPAPDEEEVDEDYGDSTQILGGRSMAGNVGPVLQSAPGEEEVDEDYGNTTRFLGSAPSSSAIDAGPEPANSEPANSEPANPRPPGRRLQDFQRRERTQNRARQFSRSPSQSSSLRERLLMARAVEPSESSEASEVSSTDDEMATLIPVELEDLWERALAGAPQMGILKRQIDSQIPYEPRVQVRSEHSGALALALSASDERLVSTGSDGTVHVWKLRGEKAVSFQPGQSPFPAAGFIHGESFLWAIEEESQIHLWLLPRAALGRSSHVFHQTIDTGGDRLRCATLMPRRKLLLTGSAQGMARIWSLKQGHCVARLADHGAPVSAVCVGQKGPITATTDGTIRFWNDRGLLIDQVETDSAVKDITAHNGSVFWTEASGALQRMDEGDSHPTRLQGHHGQGRSLALRADGHVVSAGEDGRILIYTQVGERPEQEVQVPAPIHSLVISERVLAVACEGGGIFFFGRRSSRSANHGSAL